jgi:hypothetical protein
VALLAVDMTLVQVTIETMTTFAVVFAAATMLMCACVALLVVQVGMAALDPVVSNPQPRS